MPEAAKAHALDKAASRLELLSKQVSGRELLLERFSVADACLVTVLGGSAVTAVDLGSWPREIDSRSAPPGPARASESLGRMLGKFDRLASES
jgi:hypothetical protein